METSKINETELIYKEFEGIAMELADSLDKDVSHLTYNYLDGMGDSFKKIFLNCLSDVEFHTDYKPLLKLVQGYLGSDDKGLAQSAAAFLAFCCGDGGKKRIDTELKKSNVPHKNLVKGVVSILGR